jgi:hypothetical protein
MDVTIIGNFDVIPLTINPSFSRTGNWYDYLSGDSTNVVNTQGLLSLQPGEFHIYTTMKLPTPNLGTIDTVKVLPSDYALLQNYPNPFNPSTTLTFDIPVTSKYTLKVYNILGEEVELIDEGELQPGRYQRVWDGTTSDGRRAASGVYFARFSAGGTSHVTKMMLLR